MGFFTLVHMNVCAKRFPPRFSSLVVEPKVGILMLLALVRATMTSRESCDGCSCGHKVTAELPIVQKLAAAVLAANKKQLVAWVLKSHMVERGRPLLLAQYMQKHKDLRIWAPHKFGFDA